MKFSPLSDNIVVKSLSGPEMRGSLYVPNVGDNSTVVHGDVLAVGPGRVLQTGQVVKTVLRTGDQVWFPKFNATEVEVDGEKVFVVSEQYLLGYHSELPF